MSEKSSSAFGGIGLGGAVFIVFLVLKLTGHITWSWWWVTAPLWIPLAFVAAIGIIILLWAVGSELFKGRRVKPRGW